MGPRLEFPSEKYVESFFGAKAEFVAEGLPGYHASIEREEFAAYLQRLHDHAAGKGLPEGYIASKEFWIIDADGYAGKIILGLSYYPAPERVGHHVGYAVRPSKRGLGYATRALHDLLSEARKLGITKLMPSCGIANVASRRVIERNGGVLLPPLPHESIEDRELRFLIDLDLRS